MEGYARARKAAERALELDPDLASAHMSMSWIQGFEFDWMAAEQSFRTALALEPNNALVLQRSGVVTSELGRTHEGVSLLRRAIELDPSDEVSYAFLGYLLYSTNRRKGKSCIERRES